MGIGWLRLCSVESFEQPDIEFGMPTEVIKPLPFGCRLNPSISAETGSRRFAALSSFPL
jgi:hypothetical protein